MTTQGPRQSDDAPAEPRFYLLRVWHEPGAATAANGWRASITAGTAGERRFFASIDECIDHLYGEFIRR